MIKVSHAIVEPRTWKKPSQIHSTNHTMMVHSQNTPRKRQKSWWKILNILQLRQWCERGGLPTSHLLQNRSFSLSVFCSFISRPLVRSESELVLVSSRRRVGEVKAWFSSPVLLMDEFESQEECWWYSDEETFSEPNLFWHRRGWWYKQANSTNRSWHKRSWKIQSIDASTNCMQI